MANIYWFQFLILEYFRYSAFLFLYHCEWNIFEFGVVGLNNTDIVEIWLWEIMMGNLLNN